MLEQVRASPVVQGDETGWRQDGSNGYVWTFSTPSERYFLRRGRDKGVVDEVLDSSFSGVLVSDFYAAYNHYPGLKQRCWAHLLRDIHDLKGLYPEDAGLAVGRGGSPGLHGFGPSPSPARPSHPAMLEEKLMVLARLKIPWRFNLPAHGTVHQGTVCLRVGPSRALRLAEPAALVTSRKISGGTRSGQGTDSKMTLASLFGTWRARGSIPSWNAAGCSLPLNSEQFPAINEYSASRLRH